jgi:hypothetical protein
VLRHLRSATVVLAFGLALAGLFAGWRHLFAWNQIGENYKAYYALKLTFALVLLGLATFAFYERKYAGLHMMTMAGTALMLAGVQFVGLATQSILCSTPT